MEFMLLSDSGMNAFWAAIAGAIVGATSGGLIAYVIQIKVLRENRNQREDDLKKSQQHLGYSIIAKMIMININFHTIYHHFEAQLVEKRNSDDMEPWQFVFPIANPPDPINFSSDELSMLISLEIGDILNFILLMDSKHNSLQDILANFSEKRARLLDRLTIHSVEGKHGTSNLHKDEYINLKPRMIKINNIVVELHSYARRGFEDSKIGISRLNSVLEKKLNLTYDFDILYPPATESTSSDPSTSYQKNN